MPLADVTIPSAFPGDGAFSVNAEHVHDPTIVSVAGQWFCFSTSGSGFGVVRSSSDLKRWKNWGAILPSPPEWIAARYRHRSVWAPDVVVLGKTLRCYYSVSNWGTNQSVIGLAECRDFDPARPTEGWKDLGLVIESAPGKTPFNAIDAEVLVARDGRHWMFFGSYFGGIYVVEVDAATGKLKSGAGEPVLVARNTGESGNPLEGAAVSYRDGHYYLFVSYGLAAQGVRSTYRIMVGRSKSPTGPFVDRAGKPMTDGGHVNVLKSSAPMFAPGHCDVLTAPDGRWLMPYHFYDGRRAWGDKWGLPTLQVRVLLMSHDGWPLPGQPLEHTSIDPTAKSTRRVPGKWTQQMDFGQPKTLDFRADGSVSDGEERGKWTEREGVLVVEWPRRDAPGGVWTDRLQLAYGGTYYVGRNQSGLVIRGVRQEGRAAR